MVGLIRLKLNLAQHSALKLIGDRLHLVGLNWIIVTEELSCKILSRVGDGLIGYKANLSPAKLKLADIGLELSLAKTEIWDIVPFLPDTHPPQAL